MKQVSLSGVLILLLLVFFVVGVVWNAVTIHIYILPRYSFLWMLLSGIVVLFSLAPAILLIGSALHAENMSPSGTFHDVAARELIPAFIFALILSIGYILVIPEVENKKAWYEQTSTTFNNSIKGAQKAFSEKNYAEAQRLLLIARNIDARNPEYTNLYDSVMLTIQSQMQAMETVPTSPFQEDTQESSGNSLYLAALKAKEAGRYLDAHYLARRAYAMNPERKEIQTLINDTWKLMNTRKPDQKDTEEAALFEQKVKGYSLYDEGRYLEAYQVFLSLSQTHLDDADIKLFLARSLGQLQKIAFFIEEDSLAFSLTASVPYAVSLSSDKTVFRLQADTAAYSYQGVFFRNLRLQIEKPVLMSLEAPFARIKDNTLTVRAVDRENPLAHQDPVWKLGKPEPDGVLLDFPLSEKQALLLFLIFQQPQNIPSYKLWESMKTAELYNIDTRALYLETSRRFAYPFLLLMVIMFGIGLGLRFRSQQTDSFFMQFLSSCLLVPAVIYPMDIMTNIGFSMARLIGHYTRGFVFLISWCGFLLLVSFLVIFISAKISSLFVRRR